MIFQIILTTWALLLDNFQRSVGEIVVPVGERRVQGCLSCFFDCFLLAGSLDIWNPERQGKRDGYVVFHIVSFLQYKYSEIVLDEIGRGASVAAPSPHRDIPQGK